MGGCRMSGLARRGILARGSTSADIDRLTTSTADPGIHVDTFDSLGRHLPVHSSTQQTSCPCCSMVFLAFTYM
eukprot:1157516-Pelagomonas_calceolata.AAC.3